MSRTASAKEIRPSLPVLQGVRRDGAQTPVEKPGSKVLLVDNPAAETVTKHPAIAPLLNNGWELESAVPRLVESQGTKLLVVLTHPARASRRPSLTSRG